MSRGWQGRGDGCCRCEIGGAGEDGVDVQMGFGGVGEAGEAGGEVVVFCGLDQAEVAFGQAQRGVSRQAAEDGEAEGAHGLFDAFAVAGAGGLVEDDAGDFHRGVVGGEAASGGGGGLGLAGDVQHQDYGKVEAGGEVGGGAAAAGRGLDAVEQAHGGFDDEEGAVGGGLGCDAFEEDGGHGPAVEVDACSTGGCGVEGGVDVVGAGFAGADGDAAAAEGCEQGQGDGGFAAAGAGGADDEALGHGWLP